MDSVYLPGEYGCLEFEMHGSREIDRELFISLLLCFLRD